MRTRRVTKKADKDYWNARNFGIEKILEKESNYKDKRKEEYLARQDEKMKKQLKMLEFRKIFEGVFKAMFPEAFEDISYDLISEWERVENNKEILCANIQVQQKLIRLGYHEALETWNRLFQDLKATLIS